MLTLAFAALALVFAVTLWRREVITRRLLRREAQFIDLCHQQQAWIRRGEVACHNCPELGTCVARRGCQRERTTTDYVPPPMTGAVQLPVRVRFIQE